MQLAPLPLFHFLLLPSFLLSITSSVPPILAQPGHLAEAR